MLFICHAASFFTVPPGLTVAHELRKAGVSTILLEATDRIGGRMYSKRWDIAGDPNRSVVIEMGAQWIHGIDHNPIYKLAKKLGLEMFTTPVHTGRHPDTYDSFFSTSQDGTTTLINHTDVLAILEVHGMDIIVLLVTTLHCPGRAQASGSGQRCKETRSTGRIAAGVRLKSMRSCAA